MMQLADEMRRCLEQLDVAGVRRLWRHAMPRLPQPADGAQVLIALHHARTQAASIRFKLRAWSHAWLIERGLPSGLPDALKPRAQRLYPVAVGAVGVSVRAPEHRRALAIAIQNGMNNAVREAYADGKTEPGFVKVRMMQARDRVLRG